MRFPISVSSAFSLKDLVNSVQPLYLKTAERETDDVIRSDSMGNVDASWLIEQVNYLQSFINIDWLY